MFAALEDLYRPEGGLHAAPRELAEHFDDAMIAHLVREYLDLQGEVVAEGKAVVVSAGPPGAGKSGALGSLDLRGYRVIDPDAAKDILVRHALDAGLLDYRLGFGLPDGDSVHPLELAPHIHSQSTRLTDLVRQICLDAGENIVIDGTLAWHRLPEVYIGELYRAGYENLDVVSIELPLEVASARVRGRWWVGREQARWRADSLHGLLGGRFVPEEGIARCYPAPDAESVCSANARVLAERAQDELGRGTLHRFIVLDPDSAPIPA